MPARVALIATGGTIDSVGTDRLDLASVVGTLLASDQADGVVITHGTNTLEETAYFLSLTIKSERPVVVVGSMRPASGLSADGYLNLLNAVRVAASLDAAGQGVLVVLNDTILAARDVSKTATFRVETFQGRDLGPPRSEAPPTDRRRQPTALESARAPLAGSHADHGPRRNPEDVRHVLR